MFSGWASGLCLCSYSLCMVQLPLPGGLMGSPTHVVLPFAGVPGELAVAWSLSVRTLPIGDSSLRLHIKHTIMQPGS